MAVCFIPSGLSPRDLILHFRHKVENHSDHNDDDNNGDDDGCVSDCVVFWIFTTSGSHPLQADPAGEEGERWNRLLPVRRPGDETDSDFLFVLPPTSAGAVLRVSRQQTGRRPDDGAVAVPRSESLLSLSE